MARKKITGKHLRSLGIKDNQIISKILDIVRKQFKYQEVKDVLLVIEKVVSDPKKYEEDVDLQDIAFCLTGNKKDEDNAEIKSYNLIEEKRNYAVFGKDNIEHGALQQMDTAMQLPVSNSGALMPDAHQGYGLPIGGVLAVKDAILPYAVGMDIGCRMAMSIYKVPDNYIDRYKTNLKNILIEHTRFGNSEIFRESFEHEIFDRNEFLEVPFLKKQQKIMIQQYGTSGSGNHFVEFGDLEIFEENDVLGLEKGYYLALLSHSGSRNFGYQIANYYTDLAVKNCQLPKQAKHLAWFDIDSELGVEYWKSMNLAGDYAQANHDFIHQRIAKALKEKPIKIIENHHNFAWKEIVNEQELFVHRKGATPAHANVLGLIPGSMATPGYVVVGKGFNESINSASHGAGRAMSRRKALQTFTKKDLKSVLKNTGVELIGGGLDEIPMAYKDINEVMNQQSDLVDIVARFMPRVVRMDGN